MSARDCSLALTLLLKYQLGLYNFLCLCFQRVHQPHPAHGVTGFQFLGDARRHQHPGQHGVHPFTCRPVNLQQVRVQLFAQNQATVKAGPVFLQIALPHTVIQSYVPSQNSAGSFFFEKVNKPGCRTRKSHNTQWGSCSGAQSRRSCLLWCRHGHSQLSPQCPHGRIARLGPHRSNQKR